MAFKAEHIIRFVAVAQQLSFTKAAASLGVDQPWLSQQIRQLEAHLGAALFVRNTRGLDLTETGRQLLGDATKLAQAAQEVEQTALRIRRRHTECLRFGIPTYSYTLKARVDLLDQHKRRYPHVRFEFRPGHSPQLIDQLRSHQIDTAIVAGPFDDEGLDKLLLCRSFASLLMPRESDLAKADPLTLDRLRGHRVAKMPRELNMAIWEAVYEPLARQGVEFVEIPDAHRSALYHRAHRDRLCVLTWYWPDGSEALANDMVHRLFSGRRPSLDIFLVKEAKSLNPAVDRFWGIAQDLFSRPPVKSKAAQASATS
jgi:DNA-binding transcriptional LysR family regulator